MSITHSIRDPLLHKNSHAEVLYEAGHCDGMGWPLLMGGVVWLVFVLAGSILMTHYSQSPGSSGSAPAHWPNASVAVPDEGHPTLVMFAHPRCPCSSASIGELATLMARCQGRLGAQVWFFQPAGETEGWAKTDLWRSAAAIPGVTVHVDSEGIEARRFNAETSGQVALYSQAGSLLFQGGITLSRGHSGDNPGSDAIEALLGHQFSGPVQTPVFGCALADKKCLAAEGASKQP